jgi:hypothetical protein
MFHPIEKRYESSRSPILEPVVQNKQDCPEDSGHWELRGCDLVSDQLEN